MRGKWIIGILVCIAVFLLINDYKNTNHRPTAKSYESSGYDYSSDSYSNNSYPSNSYTSQNSQTSVQSSLKAQKGEMILAKVKSPGYYKTKGNQVIELWDDGTVAEAYPAVGAYKSVAELKRAFKGAKLANPLRPVETNKINGLLLFGPINEDYDEERGKMYNVYGLIAIVGTRFEYYENTLGKSGTFTYIQDLTLIDTK